MASSASQVPAPPPQDDPRVELEVEWDGARLLTVSVHTHRGPSSRVLRVGPVDPADSPVAQFLSMLAEAFALDAEWVVVGARVFLIHVDDGAVDGEERANAARPTAADLAPPPGPVSRGCLAAAIATVAHAIADAVACAVAAPSPPTRVDTPSLCAPAGSRAADLYDAVLRHLCTLSAAVPPQIDYEEDTLDTDSETD